MLGEHEDELVETFVKRARNALFQKDQNGVRRTATDGSDSGEYAPMLLAAGTNESTFNTVFSAIKSDRKVTKPVLDAIANRYLNEPSGSNHVYKFKTKSHAFDAIKNKFFARAQAESKGGIIDRLMRRS